MIVATNWNYHNITFRWFVDSFVFQYMGFMKMHLVCWLNHQRYHIDAVLYMYTDILLNVIVYQLWTSYWMSWNLLLLDYFRILNLRRINCGLLLDFYWLVEHLLSHIVDWLDMLLLRLLDFYLLGCLLLLWFGRLSYLNVIWWLNIQVCLLNLIEALLGSILFH
mgnify:CR=1 FL=1